MSLGSKHGPKHLGPKITTPVEVQLRARVAELSAKGDWKTLASELWIGEQLILPRTTSTGLYNQLKKLGRKASQRNIYSSINGYLTPDVLLERLT